MTKCKNYDNVYLQSSIETFTYAQQKRRAECNNETKQKRKEKVMGKTMDVSTKKKDAGLHNSLVYVVQHWQLYVFFLLPALALTIIFR